MAKEKVLCVEFDDGSCSDVLVRAFPDKIEFELNHWFMGPLRAGVQRDKARVIAAALLELIDSEEPPETIQVG